MNEQASYIAQNIQKTTLLNLQNLKLNNKKFAALTAYDYSMAKAINACGIEVILVGDSLGMTIQGHQSTLSVTIEDMIYHTKIVAKGCKNALLMSDLPFGTYDTPQNAFKNAVKLIQSGANIVKIEASSDISAIIKMLCLNGIPVCAHFGLTPQFINQIGGYKVQGKRKIQAKQILNNAKLAQSAGAQLILLECIPVSLASEITTKLTIPVIGIGAGSTTDGQILVIQDLLGITQCPPKFSKNFLSETNSIHKAIMIFRQAVLEGQFPTTKHSY